MKHLRDLRIAHKLTAGFGVVCLLLAAAVALGITQLRTSQHTVWSMSAVVVPGVQSSGEVRRAFAQSRLDLAGTVLAADAEASAAARQRVQEQDALLDAAWKTYLATFPVSKASDRKAFETDLAAYRTARQPLLASTEAPDEATFVATRDTSLAPLQVRIDDVLARMQKAEIDNAAATGALGAERYRTAMVALLALGGVSVMAALVVGTTVTRSITRPLASTLAVVQGLAAGRLDQRVGHASRDEIGQLAQAVDTTVTTLASTIRDVATTSAGLTTTSQELSATATQLSTGAEESSAQSQVVSAAAEEISASIGTVAAASEQMGAAVRQIATSTADASTTASSAVTAVEGASLALQRLSASSGEIGDVVKLITSIAEQTNLLALNATIEAARAGELGKGFAVVAGEVKELARQTAQATESITARVAATLGDTEHAVAAISEISAVITRIDEIQTTIAAAVEEQSATTDEVVRSVSEVSSGSREIAVNISGVAAAADQSAAGASQVATTAAGVSRAAGELDRLMGFFTV
ncbi:methyl-accepting chemotaxis protein [Quadrisphaera setariae]|uniref:Methyl-accepting chemotaxis protein n=1 Tax=Quadrisphaera setariae TaxID=2593304 RepID=A0A5C8Z6W4_9ACTN|nr:methyl-accepting chemotaxis protein [Quadrisphaera setariae]TXR52968.1 methyl-accepting chemotaxis protein [Quadrisphaera setariae]